MRRRDRAREQEAAATRERVAAVLASARAAADAALADFMRRAPLDGRGLVIDTCGWAYIRVRKPNHRLRIALKALAATRRLGDGFWSLPCFGPGRGHPALQSISASEAAHRAAFAVIERELAGHGEFILSSHVD